MTASLTTLEAIAISAAAMEVKGLGSYVSLLAGFSVEPSQVVFKKKLGPLVARVTAEVSARDGAAEVAIKRIDAAVPLAWALRRKINQTIVSDLAPYKELIECSLNEDANLMFRIPGLRIRALTLAQDSITVEVDQEPIPLPTLQP